MKRSTPLSRARLYARTYGIRALLLEASSRLGREVLRSEVPRRLHVEISNTCNFSCEYCVLHEQSSGVKVMPQETFEAVLPYLKDASSITLSGLAEPLMNPRFSQYLARTREVAPLATISIDTNASLLTREIAEAVITSKLDLLVFSLDGSENDLVDGIRTGGSLSRVLSNVRMLEALKAQTGSDKPTLAATMVLQRKNVGELPEVVRLAGSLGVRVLSINGLEPYADGLQSGAFWTADPATGTAPLIDAVRQAATMAQEAGIELRFPSPYPGAASCTQTSRPLILSDGTVVPCSVLAYKRERFQRVDPFGRVVSDKTTTDQLSFGTLTERNLREIWMDERYRHFRNRVKSGDFPPECATCAMKHNVICANNPLSPAQFIAELERAR